MNNKDAERRGNVATRTRSIEFTPLMFGKVQIGLIHNNQRDIRGVVVDHQEMITKLKHKLIYHECTKLKVDYETNKAFLSTLVYYY